MSVETISYKKEKRYKQLVIKRREERKIEKFENKFFMLRKSRSYKK